MYCSKHSVLGLAITVWYEKTFGNVIHIVNDKLAFLDNFKNEILAE